MLYFHPLSKFRLFFHLLMGFLQLSNHAIAYQATKKNDINDKNILGDTHSQPLQFLLKITLLLFRVVSMMKNQRQA